MQDIVAGFDVGGTKISLAVADSSDTTVYREIEPTQVSSADWISSEKQATYLGVARQLARMLRAALARLQGSTLRAIGIVSAGPIRDGGLWNSTNIIPTGTEKLRAEVPRFIPLVSPLEEAFSCPVHLINDCNGGVLGEVYYGLGKTTDDKSKLHLAYATISTGFGVGAWDGGHLILGKDGNAGELGHVLVEQDGLRCGCGNRGCVEAYCSGTGIVCNARTRLAGLAPADLARSPLLGLLRSDAGEGPALGAADVLLASLTSVQIFEAALIGDAVAKAVIRDAVFAGGVALSALANAYDPQIISVGGSIALAHPWLLDEIREEALRHLNVAPPEIVLSPLANRVTEQGAIAVARSLLT